jgi:hypothetical protein
MYQNVEAAHAQVFWHSHQDCNGQLRAPYTRHANAAASIAVAAPDSA